MRRALVVILAVAAVASLTGCRPAGPPPPSAQYRQDLRACDELPSFGDRALCAGRAVKAETRRREAQRNR